MRILFACGGTGGHINPAIAVASYIRERHPEAVIQFAGSPKGMEAKLVTKAGFDFAPIIIKGFQRKLNWRNIKYNVSSVFYLTTASMRAEKLIKNFAPDIVVGTGGYVSGPILRKAAKMGIKTLSHESNAFPGVTTKLLARYVDKILLAVPEAKKYLPDSCQYAVTGNPVRESIIFADREKARAKFNLNENDICILSCLQCSLAIIKTQIFRRIDGRCINGSYQRKTCFAMKIVNALIDIEGRAKQCTIF